jgi:hypothetical protein
MPCIFHMCLHVSLDLWEERLALFGGRRTLAGPPNARSAILLASALVGAVLIMKARRPNESSNSLPPASRSISAAAGSLDSKKTYGALQPLERNDVLRDRTSDTFPAGYLTIISIIQGVALATLLSSAVPAIFHRASTAHSLAVAGRTAMLLAAIIIVSYEYLWFTTLMRWAPTFLDTVVPYALGVGEIVPSILIEDEKRWWPSVMFLLATAALAFYHTIVRSSPAMFPTNRDVYVALRRLLAQLTGCCLADFAAAATISALLLFHRGPPWLPTLMPWAITAASSVFVILSERVLTSIYDAYEIPRRWLMQWPWGTHPESIK